MHRRDNLSLGHAAFRGAFSFHGCVLIYFTNRNVEPGLFSRQSPKTLVAYLRFIPQPTVVSHLARFFISTIQTWRRRLCFIFKSS